MKVGYGPITCQRHPGDQRSDTEIYQEALELAEEAERLGFDTVWVCEHHFVDDGFLPSLLVMCAAIAARTSSIKLGAGTVLVPFFNPLSVAEDATVVDLISGGRLVLGLGQGWRPEELAAFRLRPAELPARLIDCVRTLRAAWKEETVTPPLSVTPLVLRPRPAQRGGPPVWIGAETRAAIRRAGEIADGWQATMVDPGAFGQQCAWALEGVEIAGRDPRTFSFGLHHATFTWEDGDAWELIKPYHQYFIWKSERMEQEWVGQPADGAAKLTDMADDFARGLIAVGSPEEVIEQIQAFQAVAPVPIDYAARTYFPGLDPAIQRRSMQLFARKVLPVLQAEAPRALA